MIFPVIEVIDEASYGLVLLFNVGLYLLNGLFEVEEVVLLVLEVLKQGQVCLFENGVLISSNIFGFDVVQLCLQFANLDLEGMVLLD